jgi:hypothetical protein
MAKTLEEIQKELPDCYNHEFMVRYNWALQSLEKDKMALVTFNLAIIDTIKMFATQNKKTFLEYLDLLKIQERGEDEV